MQCVILAGGLGTRMRPHTERTPKVLLPVAGQPFVDHQLSWLASEGIDDVVLCVGHLGDRVEAHVGGGGRWGLTVRYSAEGDALRGTGGALRLAHDTALLDDRFLVLYGDSYLDVRIADVWATFRQSGAPALMTVFRNAGRWGRSNASYRDGWVVRYDKSGCSTGDELAFIDYGLLAFDRSTIGAMVPEGAAMDLAPLLGTLAEDGQLAGFEAVRRYHEIGSPEGLRELEARLGRSRGRASSPTTAPDRRP